MKAIAALAFSSASATDGPTPPSLGPPSVPTRISTGTTARSCSSRIEKTERPVGVPSSRRAASSCITTAVDENARTSPTSRAVRPSSPCDAAISKGLGCLAKTGNLDILRQLDRPAILKFLNGRNEPVYATLISLNTDQATLRVGNRDFEVPLSDLESRWFGDYTLLWRMPPAYTGAIRLGTSGEDVQWLASSIASINGEDVPGIISYDARLIRAVKNFQKQEGLSADGIAGVQTLIQINSALDKSVPRLTSSSGKSNSINKQSATVEEIQSATLLAWLG